MQDKYFYIKFNIGSIPRFEKLKRFFDAMKEEKDRRMQGSELDGDPPEDDPKWTGYLDEEALEWFSDTFDFESDEGRVYTELWKLTAPAIRLSHPMFTHPGNWDFESMIDAIFNGEYELITCDVDSDATGVLYYDPWAGPFGGSESLVALIESFGHQVTYDSWHEGPHKRRVVGWNYEEAKRLVAKGIGVTLD